jgi:hypothetical protein
MNLDDVCYSSIAVEYASTGEWRPAFQPLGLAKTERFFAANPILTPYSSAMFVKFFGPDRWVFQLASLGAFIAAGVALSWTISLLELHRLHSLLVLFSYYACPWLYYAMNSARAEPISIACIYLAVLFAVLYIKFPAALYSPGWLLLSGALTVTSFWNHPLFLMTGLLPIAFILSYHNKVYYKRGVLVWLIGASAMFVFLVGWRILPHLDAWREQFLANASSNAHLGKSSTTFNYFQSTLPFPLNKLVELKARFSTLGWPFVCWYVGLPVLSLLFLRPTRLFWIALISLGVWLGLIEIKTFVYANYVVNVVMALPLCLMLALPNRRGDHLSRPVWLLMVAFVILCTVLHAWLVLRPATRTNDWLTTEQQLERVFRTLPPHSIIWGDSAEAMLPAWKQGDIYYFRPNTFLANIPGVRERLDKLAADPADYRLEFIDNHWIVQKNE